MGCKKTAKGDEYLVLERWMGLGNKEALEPMSRVSEDAPAVLKELKRLRLSSDVTKKLRERYGFSIWN